MNEMTRAITEIKRKVAVEKWRSLIQDCQNSGMSVKLWCSENGISPSTYYAHLRKIRGNIIEENRIVPLETHQMASSEEIRIESEGISVTLPTNISSEQLTAILRALKLC